FPMSLLINYQDVKNIINAHMNKLSRKSCRDKHSCEKWMKYLEKEKNCSTLFFKDSYLFTIVVHNYITNRGLPVCFFITDMETISTLHQWLTWIKANFSLNVKRIMIDCGSAETSAIRDVFEGPVQILLFHWHIKRAWETHIKRDAKISKSSHDTKLVRDRVCANLNSMMYSETPKAFDLAYQLFLAENMEFEVFLAYFNRLRLPRKKLWSKAWKQTASFHTNNMIESYHNQLKTFYLGHSRSLRVDRLVYLLSQVVALDYWQDTIKAAHDFGGFRLTANEEKKGRAAYCIDYDVACSMIEQLEENMDTKEGYLKNCSCPDQTKMCKHIFLVSRVTKLLFLL
ncbi:hypothetical protein BCV71DRAFT_165197, partial [Rhizopus microsporus]